MIADKVGTSKVSVSKALNNQPGVGEALKRSILEVSKELGYFNGKVKKPVESIKKTGFLVSKRFFLESENFYTKIYYYLNKECAQKGINLFLYVISSTDEKDLVFPFSFLQDIPNALFIAGEIDEAYIHSIINFNIPVIAIDSYKLHTAMDCIVTDNFYSSYTATIHLIDNGHRNIGFVGNPNFTSGVADRFYGYMKALSQNGLEYHKEWHIINNDPFGIYNVEYSLPETLPTAFLCHCDMAAYQLMLKLQINGISIPDQISLVSFDNTDLSRNCKPQLTTIDINKREIAHKALQQLFWRNVNPSAEPQRILLNTHLIERSSVRKI
jgi:LacI family transcriptional regulator